MKNFIKDYSDKRAYTLTSINHASIGNPHLQYDNFIEYSSQIVTSADQYIKILDINIQPLDTTLKADKKHGQGLMFIFLLYNTRASGDLGAKIVQFQARMNVSGTDYTTNCNYFSLNNSTDIADEQFIVYKKLVDSATNTYNIKLYLKPLYAGIQYMINPISLYTNPNDNGNSYDIKSRGKYNYMGSKILLDNLMSDFTNNIYASATVTTDTSGYTVSNVSITQKKSVVTALSQLPSSPKNGDSCFYVPTKQDITYYNGSWYSNGVVVTVS